MVNRPDALDVVGGDTVQMLETARGLRSLGIEVETRCGPQSLDDYRAFDVAHLFNLQTPEFTLPELEKASEAKVRIALSTIYWDFGAELLLAHSAKWQSIQRIAGRAAALSLARKWSHRSAAESRVKVRRCIELASVLLPNSKAEVEQLRGFTPNLPKVQVVPNGIDAVRFDPNRELARPSWAPVGDYALIVARIEPDKNQAAFCEAVNGVGLPVFLVGKVRNEAEAARCKAAGATLVGPLAGDDLVAAYKYARVHVLPSFRETPGLASLEAAAMGCAIVTTSCGCALEYFGDDAVYVSPTVPESFAAAFAQASKAGPPSGLAERVRTEFDWSAAAKITAAAYVG